MFRFATPRPPRRLSLTPMIDVVFLLLVFYMLVAQFGQDGALPISGGGAQGYDGPPRLVEVTQRGLTLNGAAITPHDLLAALDALSDGRDDIVVLRGRDGATLQDLVGIAEHLSEAGFTRLAVPE